MLISSKGIETLNAENSFLPGFKWDMGQIHMLFPKKILCHPTKVYESGVQKGLPFIYTEPVSEAFKLLHEELLREELLKDETLKDNVEALETRVKEEMDKVTDKDLFDKYNKYTSVAIHTNLCRKINVPDVFTNRIKVPLVRDKGEYVPTLVDKLYSLTKDIVNNKIESTKANLTAMGSEDEIIKETVSSLKRNKPIGAKAFRYAVACPFLICDANKNLNTKDLDVDNLFSLNIFTFGGDMSDMITDVLHSDSDIYANFLPLQITHPMIRKGSSDKQKKGQSALKATILSIAKDNSPTNKVSDFYDKLNKFYIDLKLESSVIEASVYDFYEKSDDFILETIKSWMVTQTQYITPDVKTKYADMFETLDTVASNGEVEDIVNNNANPNTIYTQAQQPTQQQPMQQPIQQQPMQQPIQQQPMQQPIQQQQQPMQQPMQQPTQQDIPSGMEAQQPNLDNFAINLNQ